MLLNSAYLVTHYEMSLYLTLSKACQETFPSPK